MKRFGKADATRTQSVAYGLSFRAYAIGLWPRYANALCDHDTEPKASSQLT
ncbi:MAG: hypothetical protein F6J98_12565 [Moorea sp. SIO4G2]|uniref:hypothetical protein n=1 Tax=unclassified Moorena TaxID=2683338 RepID=UPI0013F72E33|nr:MULTISPECIES: hypothetical protein [unclassified Moorena]NEO14464.1 hypothetical protein [Moorena sp. SIO3E8]NEO61223.1 hypothetical protein [Moorena sp. SIO4G2]NEP98467.1 hypothetical protein [Moorena sp. SIO3F7]